MVVCASLQGDPARVPGWLWNLKTTAWALQVGQGVACFFYPALVPPGVHCQSYKFLVLSPHVVP